MKNVVGAVRSSIACRLELAERVQEVDLVPDQGAIQELAPARLFQRFIREFMRGIWMPVVTAFGRRRSTARHRGEAKQCSCPSRWRDL
jgi:hypothetical protein